MLAYLDSSVVLRMVFRERNALAQWGDIERPITSTLTRVESLRALDRRRLREALTEEDLALRYQAVHLILDAITSLDLDRLVLERASRPFPVPLATLDAIHLATALRWHESTGEEVAMATHDRQLAIAARASGLQVIGV